MKKFFKNIFTFVFSLTIISIFLIRIIYYFYERKLHDTRLDKNISTIICGDSHTMCAINDSKLKNTINISNFSQHYLYTYNVLNVVLENNPQINTIILGSSFHSFSDFDKYILDNDIAFNFYPDYFPILDYESENIIVSNNVRSFFNSGDDIIKLMVRSLLSNDKSYLKYSFIGSYHQSKNSNLNDSTVSQAIKRHFYQTKGAEQGFSSYQKKYFNDIVLLCLNKNIKLIIVNTPISDEYYDKIPAKFIKNYYSNISSLKNKIVFWDLHSFHLENTSFGDGDHLNTYGASKFTLKIDSLLNNRTLNN